MYVGGFLEETATIPQISCVNCGLYCFLKGKSYFEMPTPSPFLNLGFPSFRSGLLYRKDKKAEFFTFFVIKSTEQFLQEFLCCNKFSQFVKVLVSIVFHVTVKYNFQGSYCTFSKCSIGLTRCRVNLYCFSFS